MNDDLMMAILALDSYNRKPGDAHNVFIGFFMGGVRDA